MTTNEKLEKTRSKFFWIMLMNRNFRVLYKFRDQKNYSLIGAGTIFKIVDEITGLEAIRKALNSSEQIVQFDVKNVVNFKFYSK